MAWINCRQQNCTKTILSLSGSRRGWLIGSAPLNRGINRTDEVKPTAMQWKGVTAHFDLELFNKWQAGRDESGTMALDQRSLRLFEACSCKPASEGLPSSLKQHRA